MRYTIKHFDLPLLSFEANMDSASVDLRIVHIYEENRAFFPLNLSLTENGLERWLRHRTIPKNRAYVDAIYSLSSFFVLLICRIPLLPWFLRRHPKEFR